MGLKFVPSNQLVDGWTKAGDVLKDIPVDSQGRYDIYADVRKMGNIAKWGVYANGSDETLGQAMGFDCWFNGKRFAVVIDWRGYFDDKERKYVVFLIDTGFERLEMTWWLDHINGFSYAR